MKKYIAKQVPSEAVYVDYLLDDEGIGAAVGLDHKLFVATVDRWGYNHLLNKDEFDELIGTMDSIIEWFDELELYIGEGYTPEEIYDAMSGYANYKLIIEYLLSGEDFIDYSETLEDKLKDFVSKSLGMANYETFENLAEFLSIVTGKQWTCDAYRGYCQGDYAEVLYCSDVYPKDSVELYGNAAVGCVTEFDISEYRIDTKGKDIDTLIQEAERLDFCRGYFVTDSDVWNNRAKEKLSEMLGVTPDEIEVMLIKREYQIPKYEYAIC